GYLPLTQLWDVNTTFKTDIGNYEPKNYDLREHGPVSMRSALAGSLNIPAIQTTYLVGVGSVIDFAERLGYTTFGKRSDFGLSIGLGGGTVTPLEHANAFSAFAQDGKQKPTSAILKVEKPDGSVLEEWKDPEAKQVVEPQVARLLTDVMTDNNARAFIFGSKNYLTLPDRQVAAKTGTTNNNKDAWTAGFTPNLVTVVWVGNTDGKEMKQGADGSIIAAPIWQGYMKRATAGMDKESFIKPDAPSTTKPALLGQVVEKTVKVNKLNGKLASDLTPPDLIEERVVHEAHTILYYVDKDDPTGPAPTNPASDPQFVNWESAVQSYVQRTQWMATSTMPTEVDDLYTAENKPTISITSPSTNENIGSRTLTIQTSVQAQRTIKTVSAYIDDTLIGTANASPWSIYSTIPNDIDVGYHTLKVRAVDELGAVAEQTVQINLTAAPDLSLSGFNLLSPQRNETWSRSTFPRTFVVHMDEPTRYARVTVSLVNNDTKEKILVGSLQLPTEQQNGFTLSAGPVSGNYTVEAVATQKDDVTLDTITESLRVTD
ncbi:MAG: penicillin-binding transpeptidase domain-containing protein, partial [Patescibacteria group bacterium]